MVFDGANDFKLRYVGSRFSGPRLPFDVLADLPALRDLLAAFAEDIWREANPSRQRVPKGFDKILTFSLTGVDNGSAMPAISWDPAATQPALPGLHSQTSLVRMAHDQVVRLFDAAGQGRFPDALSGNHLRALNRFGATLRDNEKIEFYNSQGSDGRVVFLDAERRKRLITHIRPTYEKRIEGIGRLVGIYEDGELTLRSEPFGDIKVPVERGLVTEASEGKLGASVFYDLIAELDHGDRLRGIQRVDDVRLVDDDVESGLEHCEGRLTELAALNDGWHDGAGSRIDPIAIENARKFLLKRPDHCADFRIYPNLDSGIQIEFVLHGWDFSVEFLPNGYIEFYGVSVDGSDEIDPISFDALSDEFYGEYDRMMEDTRTRQ